MSLATDIAEKFEIITDEVYSVGRNEGYKFGHNEGYIQGLNEANKEKYDEGYADGYTEGVEAQKAVSVDWGIIQDEGNRTAYNRGFASWSAEEINPKYMIEPTTTNFISAFQACTKLKKVDWKKFDLTKGTSFYQTFNSCFELESIETDLIPVSLVANCWDYTFSGCWALKMIQKIKAFVGHTWQYAFNRCDALEEIRFTEDSEIANNISFADSPKLTRESIVSILEALANNLTTMKTLTFNTGLANGNGFERLLKDQIVGNDAQNYLDKTETVYFPAESGTINEVTYRKGGSYIELSGTSIAETRINLLNTPIIFPETPSDTVKDMSLQGYQYINHGTASQYGYLRATVQRTDGTVEEYYLNEYSSGYFEQGDIITSIDLVIPEGVAFGDETVYAWYIYVDYLYWLEESLLYRCCWNVVY